MCLAQVEYEPVAPIDTVPVEPRRGRCHTHANLRGRIPTECPFDDRIEAGVAQILWIPTFVESEEHASADQSSEAVAAGEQRNAALVKDVLAIDRLSPCSGAP